MKQEKAHITQFEEGGRPDGISRANLINRINKWNSSRWLLLPHFSGDKFLFAYLLSASSCPSHKFEIIIYF